MASAAMPGLDLMTLHVLLVLRLLRLLLLLRGWLGGAAWRCAAGFLICVAGSVDTCTACCRRAPAVVGSAIVWDRLTLFRCPATWR